MTTKKKVETYLTSVGAKVTIMRDPVWKTVGGWVDPPEYHIWSHNGCHSSCVPDCESMNEFWNFIWQDICQTNEVPIRCENEDCDVCEHLKE